jgi:tripartite-type tricarboxylate transporter receptor subunit TctC
MKYLLAIILSLVYFNSYAELPLSFNVYVAARTGSKYLMCRTLFDLYSQKYNADITLIPKEGATGLLATLEMINNKKFSILCSGPQENVFNDKEYPGHESEYKSLTMISIIGIGASTFYTGANSKFKDINDLKNLSRPITIGYNAMYQQKMAQLVFKSHPIILVRYNNSATSIPSLIDGTLDIYSETGALESLVDSGKLKSLGHINGADTLHGDNITKDYPDAAKLLLYTGITTTANNDAKDIEEMNRRLKPLANSKEMLAIIDNMGWTPVFYSVKQSNEVISNYRNQIEKLENVK